MHITNQGYLKDAFLYFMGLLDGNIEESNKIKELDKTTAILGNNDKHLPDLLDLKVK